MNNRVRHSLFRAGLLSLLCMATLAEAAPRHALTLYDEKPKYPANFQHFEYVNPEAPKGGTLRQAGFGSFDSLNPFINKGVAADDIGLIYDTLTTNSLDEPFTVYGLLAEKIEKGPNNSWVRFHLRPQARFHDGEPVTADDVVFTFETLMSKGAPHYRGYYADVEKVVAESPRRVRFDFKHAGNRGLPMIPGPLPVLPKHWWEGREFTSGSLEIPLGSGPYRVEKVQAGRSIRYARVEDYWGKDLPVNRGFYNFDHVNFDYYRDNTVALQAFKAGHFDYWFETSAKNWATAYDIAAVRDGRIAKDENRNYNPTGMQGLICNIRRPSRHRASTSAARPCRIVASVKPWACCSTTNGPIASCSTVPTPALAATSTIPSWPPPGCRARTSSRSSNRCAARCRTRYSIRLSNCHKPRATA